MFITLDGIDGSGKSTQLQLLSDWLECQQYTIARFRDPGSTMLGEAVRDILLHREDIPLALNTEMLLYMAARSQLVAQCIRPALESGQIVIADRYLLANVVYQGCAGGMPVDAIWQVGAIATQGIQPDLTIVLDLPVEIARSRLSGQPDRLEKRSLDYFQKVRDGFIQQVAQSSPHHRIVDATQSIEAIHHEIRTACQTILNHA